MDQDMSVVLDRGLHFLRQSKFYSKPEFKEMCCAVERYVRELSVSRLTGNKYQLSVCQMNSLFYNTLVQLLNDVTRSVGGVGLDELDKVYRWYKRNKSITVQPKPMFGAWRDGVGKGSERKEEELIRVKIDLINIKQEIEKLRATSSLHSTDITLQQHRQQQQSQQESQQQQRQQPQLMQQQPPAERNASMFQKSVGDDVEDKERSVSAKMAALSTKRLPHCHIYNPHSSTDVRKRGMGTSCHSAAARARGLGTSGHYCEMGSSQTTRPQSNPTPRATETTRHQSDVQYLTIPTAVTDYCQTSGYQFRYHTAQQMKSTVTTVASATVAGASIAGSVATVADSFATVVATSRSTVAVAPADDDDDGPADVSLTDDRVDSTTFTADIVVPTAPTANTAVPTSPAAADAVAGVTATTLASATTAVTATDDDDRPEYTSKTMPGDDDRPKCTSKTMLIDVPVGTAVTNHSADNLSYSREDSRKDAFQRSGDKYKDINLSCVLAVVDQVTEEMIVNTKTLQSYELAPVFNMNQSDHALGMTHAKIDLEPKVACENQLQQPIDDHDSLSARLNVSPDIEDDDNDKSTEQHNSTSLKRYKTTSTSIQRHGQATSVSSRNFGRFKQSTRSHLTARPTTTTTTILDWNPRIQKLYSATSHSATPDLQSQTAPVFSQIDRTIPIPSPPSNLLPTPSTPPSPLPSPYPSPPTPTCTPQRLVQCIDQDSSVSDRTESDEMSLRKNDRVSTRLGPESLVVEREVKKGSNGATCAPRDIVSIQNQLLNMKTKRGPKSAGIQVSEYPSYRLSRVEYFSFITSFFGNGDQYTAILSSSTDDVDGTNNMNNNNTSSNNSNDGNNSSSNKIDKNNYSNLTNKPLSFRTGNGTPIKLKSRQKLCHSASAVKELSATRSSDQDLKGTVSADIARTPVDSLIVLPADWSKARMTSSASTNRTSRPGPEESHCTQAPEEAAVEQEKKCHSSKTGENLTAPDRANVSCNSSACKSENLENSNSEKFESLLTITKSLPVERSGVHPCSIGGHRAVQGREFVGGRDAARPGSVGGHRAVQGREFEDGRDEAAIRTRVQYARVCSTSSRGRA